MSKNKKLKDILNGALDKAIEDTQSESSKFKIEPVQPKEFFEEWLKEPLFPDQYGIINQVFTEDYKDWNTTIKEILLLWGEGCIDGSTRIVDVATKEGHSVSQWAALKKQPSIVAYDINEAEFKVVKADVPYKKGTTLLYKVKVKQGNTTYHSINVSRDHKFYTPSGWKKLKDLKKGDLIASKRGADAYLATLSEEQKAFKLGRVGTANGRHGKKWSKEHRQKNGSLIKKSTEYQAWLISDERKVTIKKNAKLMSIRKLKDPQSCIHEGSGRCHWETYKSPIAGTIKIQGSYEKKFARLLDAIGCTWSRCLEWFPYEYQGKKHNYQPDFIVRHPNGIKTYYEIKGWVREVDHVKLNAVRQAGHHIVMATKEVINEVKDTLKLPTNKTHLNFKKIESIDPVGTRDFYDFNVPVHHNYLLNGMLHHNSSKDYTTVRTLVYACYWMCCLRDPHLYFAIGANTPIVLACVSVNEDHAKDVFFRQFTTCLRNVRNPSTGKNFFEGIGVDLREGKDIQTRKVLFPNHIEAYALDASRYAGEGKNILFTIFDEIAEVRYDKAKTRYDNLRNTAFSRFPNHYKIAMISYPRDEFDFMMSHWNDIDSWAPSDKDAVFRSCKAPWEVRSKEGAHPELIKRKIYKTKEDYVPIYRKDPVDAARRYECKFPKGTASRYLKQFELVLNRCIKFKRPAPIIWEDTDRDDQIYLTEVELLNSTFQPWLKPEYSYEAYKIEQELFKNPNNLEAKAKLEAELERHSGAQYFIHIDLSQGIYDDAGLVLLHTYQQTPTQMGYYVDLAVQIRPEDNEINFEDIRKFVFALDKQGFEITTCTLDGFQSVDFQQILTRYGIESDTISVDRTQKPYDTLKGILYQGRVDMYYYPVLTRELKELRKDERGKIDHPKESAQRLKEEGKKAGSKDVADALAGAIYSAVLSDADVGPAVVDSSDNNVDVEQSNDEALKDFFR